MNSKLEFEDGEYKVANMMMPQIKLSLALNARKIVINDDISEAVSMEFMYLVHKIKDLDVKLGEKLPIEIDINTNGGSATDCFLIVDLIEQLKKEGYQIITVNVGKAYSAGCAIALAGSIRKSYSRARYMVHDVSSGSIGKVRSMEEQLEETKIIRNIYFDIIKKYSNIPDDIITKCIDNQSDVFLSAIELKEYKGIEEIL